MFTHRDNEVEGQEGPTFKVNGQCFKAYYGELHEISLT